MIISISGTPGSGKTTVGKQIAEQLNMPFYSIGHIRGRMAKERGMTLDEFNALGEKESFTDTEVDTYQKELGEREDRFVIEGRLCWHFIPHSFKVYLSCDVEEAAKRIFLSRCNAADDRSDEPLYESPESVKAFINERMASDDRRYLKYYGLRYRDPKHYDLVIDTTNTNGPEEVTKRILKEISNKSKG